MSSQDLQHRYGKTAVYPNLLPERLGEAFFDQLPSEPGVYWMLDAAENILYVGQSQNLRKRLFSYARAGSEAVSPKIMRLVYHTKQIQWEICESGEAARLLENQLLRRYHPPYNRVNTHPENYLYLGYSSGENVFRFGLSRNPDQLPLTYIYGAFKTLRLLRQIYGSLLRVFWFATHPRPTHTNIPMSLMSKRPPDLFEIGYPDIWTDEICKRWDYLIRRYLKGTGKTFIHELERLVTDPGHAPESFLEHMTRNDLHKLEDGYQKVTRKRYLLFKSRGVNYQTILQEDLDDLIALNPLPDQQEEQK